MRVLPGILYAGNAMIAQHKYGMLILYQSLLRDWSYLKSTLPEIELYTELNSFSRVGL